MPRTGRRCFCQDRAPTGTGNGGSFGPDAAFAKSEVYGTLEEREVEYATRRPANASQLRYIKQLPTRPVVLVTNRSCGTRVFSIRRTTSSGEDGVPVLMNRELVTDEFAATSSEKRGRYCSLFLAEATSDRQRFAAMLIRSRLQPVPTG